MKVRDVAWNEAEAEDTIERYYHTTRRLTGEPTSRAAVRGTRLADFLEE